MLDKEPVLLSGITELGEKFVLDCYKGKPVPKEVDRVACKHGAKAKNEESQVNISQSAPVSSVIARQLQKR